MAEQSSAASRITVGDKPSSLWVNIASTAAAATVAPAISRRLGFLAINAKYTTAKGWRNQQQSAGPKPRAVWVVTSAQRPKVRRPTGWQAGITNPWV